MKRNYIKNLEFRIFSNGSTKYVTVDYDRGNEHEHYTLSNVPAWVVDDKTVRQFINL